MQTTKLNSFEYDRVSLLSGPFAQQREDTIALYLEHPGIDEALHHDRVLAGISSPSQGMPGWGPSLGQYWAAFAKLYRATGDERIRMKCLALFRGWVACADKNEAVLDKGTYMYDKFMGGLLDMYEHMGLEEARDYAMKLTLRAKASFDTSIPRDGVQDSRMKGQIEWYTLPENLYRAYKLFGDNIYKDYADEWLYHDMYDKIDAGDFAIGPRHAYSHVNSLSSAAQAYIVHGDKKYLRVIEKAYQELVNHHTYVTGGYGPAEMLFGDKPDYLGDMLKSAHDYASGEEGVFKSFWGGKTLRSDTWGSCEVSCCTWAVFKLCNYLLKLTGDARYGGWAEKLLVNGLLGQLPITQGGKVMYYADYFINGGLKSVEDRRLVDGGGNNVWQCCTGTFPNDVAEYANMIYYQDEGGLYISQFIPSRVDFLHEGRSVGLESSAQFPQEQRAVFTIRAAAPIRFTLSIRVPSWVKGSAGLSINGEKQALDIRPDTWLKVDRDWHDGDKLIFDFPYALAFSPVDAINSNIVALTYGPLALVSDEMTLLVGDVNRPEDWLKPVEGSFATFDTLPGHAGKQLFLTRRFSPYYQIGPMTWYFMYNRIYPDLESIPRRPWN